MPAQLTLRQLSYFVAVAEECHFRRAAARLHVSQPPLTQRIQALERDLGVQLFTRSGGHVELTEAGHVVLREAQATLAQAERVREVARQVGQGEAGRLRVSVVISAPFVVGFSEAANAFQRDNPAVVLEMAENTARTAIEALRQRKVDMCVVRKVAPELTGVEQILIGNDQLMLVLPSTHPLAAGIPASRSTPCSRPMAWPSACAVRVPIHPPTCSSRWTSGACSRQSTWASRSR